MVKCKNWKCVDADWPTPDFCKTKGDVSNLIDKINSMIKSREDLNNQGDYNYGVIDGYNEALSDIIQVLSK